MSTAQHTPGPVLQPGYYWCIVEGSPERHPIEWTGKEWWGIAMQRPYDSSEITDPVPAIPPPIGRDTKAERMRRLRSQRIDSPAFRHGVRAFKTGASNPYNGPELRDFWEAGRNYARVCAETEAEFAKATGSAA